MHDSDAITQLAGPELVAEPPRKRKTTTLFLIVVLGLLLRLRREDSRRLCAIGLTESN
jgi:hypothetical protein